MGSAEREEAGVGGTGGRQAMDLRRGWRGGAGGAGRHRARRLCLGLCLCRLMREVGRAQDSVPRPGSSPRGPSEGVMMSNPRLLSRTKCGGPDKCFRGHKPPPTLRGWFVRL